MTIVYVIVGLIVLAAVAAKLYLAAAGIEDIRVDTSAPVVVEAQDDNSIVLSKKLNFYNEGKQCATIMDAICRSQLPYEQYDGIDARGKAECEGCPREDDYFEAYIIQRKGYGKDLDRATIKAQIKLIARHGMTIKEAISKMPDFNFLIIWMEAGRMEAHYRQVRIEVPAAEIAKLVGTELVEA